MQARVVPADHGARWLAEGWLLFRAAPLGWLALVFAYVFVTQLVSLVPLAGPVVAAMLVPAFSVGLMGAARAASRGGRVELAMLFEAFRDGLRAQLVLGAVYAACLLAVMAGAALATGGEGIGAALDDARSAEGRWQLGALVAVLLVLYAPVMMLFWFAPPLAAWHSAPPAKALFFSFFAFLMNWRAFLVYGAVGAVAVAAVPFAALYVFGLLAGAPSRAAANAMVLALVLVLMPTLFGSFYASYRDVFAGEGKA